MKVLVQKEMWHPSFRFLIVDELNGKRYTAALLLNECDVSAIPPETFSLNQEDVQALFSMNCGISDFAPLTAQETPGILQP